MLMDGSRGDKIHPEVSTPPRHGHMTHVLPSKAEPNRGMEPAVQGCGYMTTHSFMKLITLLTALYQGGQRWVFSYDQATGVMCSSSSVCANTRVTQILLTGSSFLAGALFAGIAVCIFSKCYATRYFLHHSWIQLIVDFEPTHDLHTSFGTMAFVAGILHGILHVTRYIVQNNTDLLYAKAVNRSGLVAVLLLLPTAAPMGFACCRRKLTFEFRKVMHMTFVPFLIALCFHSRGSSIVFSVLLVWYLLDRLYFTTRQTFFIETPSYKTVGRGTLVRIDLPSGYQFKAGSYAQVNCPAISASEWHPFSLFPVPGSGKRAGMHIEAVGDWTQELFRLGLESPQMPLWITAAQPSSIEKTIYFENVLLVCTGAGITPAVSAADRFAKKKNIHLLWMSREASMVALFEKQLRRVKSTVHLTGKPNGTTKRAMMELFAPAREGSSEGSGRVGRSSSREPQPSKGHTRDSSRDSSFSDLRMLEAGTVGSSRHDRSKSVDREEKVDYLSDEESALGSCLSGSVRKTLEDRSRKEERHQKRREEAERKRRSKGYHPVSLKFGRPDISRFIADTVQFHTPPPTPDWSEVDHTEKQETRPARLAQVIERLNTGQRLSKHNLMQADISVVEESRNNSRGNSRSVSRSNSRKNLHDPLEADAKPANASAGGGLPWLVVYCGANGTVERAISSVCEELKITWRKEYFSTW